MPSFSSIFELLTNCAGVMRSINANTNSGSFAFAPSAPMATIAGMSNSRIAPEASSGDMVFNEAMIANTLFGAYRWWNNTSFAAVAGRK